MANLSHDLTHVRHPMCGTRGRVATTEPLATSAGIEILRAGGYMQPQGHMQVVVALADDGLDPQAALDRARFNIVDGTAGGSVNVEPGVPEATLSALADMGHPISRSAGLAQVLYGRGQVIRREPDGVLWGGTDPRADGCVMTL